MAIKLNKRAIEYAKNRIQAKEVDHLKAPWSEHKATEDEKDKFIENHSIDEYGQWFLGEDTREQNGGGKERFDYPYGDLKMVHISALQVSEDLARKNGHLDIAEAAQKLLDLAQRDR